MRLIDADELKLSHCKECTLYPNKCMGKDCDWGSIAHINMMPTIDAVPVRHGKWLSREEGCVYPFWERYTCSACGKHADNTEYCPHCGARMVKDDQTD